MRPRAFRTTPLHDLVALNESQGKVPGFDLAANQAAGLLLVGAGGIGSHVALGLVRKGYGRLYACDEDFAETKNLSRQLFGPEDIGKNKAIRLARRLAKEGFFPGVITGFPCWFQKLRDAGMVPQDISGIVCGVDNNRTRVDVSKYAIAHGLPIIHAGIARDGSALYCFVQEPGKACFGCVFPDALNDNSFPCNLPGIIDVLQIVAGFVVFATDTLVSGRYREWNYASLTLHGALKPIQTTVGHKPHCPLCGVKESSDATA